jgi:hypothetical protein
MCRQHFGVQIRNGSDPDEITFRRCGQMVHGNKTSGSDKADMDLFHNKKPLFG